MSLKSAIYAVIVVLSLTAPFFALADDLRAQVQDSEIRFQRGNVAVTIVAGNIMQQDADAAAFPSSRSGGGDELIVGSLLREAGAEKGFLEFEKMFRENTYADGSVQIAEAGGGRFTYIINAATQSFDSQRLESVRGHEGSDIKLHAREQQLIALTMANLLHAVADSPIRSVALPMFGTGSFHGMHPFLSLIAMLAGVETYQREAATVPLKIRIVWFGRPGTEATKFFREKVLPAIELGLQQPEEFAKFTQSQWDQPIQAMADFKIRLEPAAACEQKLAPAPAAPDQGRSGWGRLFDFLRPRH